MPEVFNTVAGPAGPVHRARVTIRLVADVAGPAPGYVTTAEATVVDVATVLTDNAGLWLVDLTANSTPGVDAPAGTWYEVVTVAPGRPAVTETIQVPAEDGPWWAGDLLILAPGVLPSPHEANPSGAHAASAISYTGTVDADNVADALDTLDATKADVGAGGDHDDTDHVSLATAADLTAHTGAAAPHAGHETPAGAQTKADDAAADAVAGHEVAVDPHGDRAYTDQEVATRVATADLGVTVATLDGGGKIPSDQLPPLAIGETFAVASEAAMLALDAQRGDVAVRTDLDPDRVLILTTDSPGTLGDWVEITAAGSVLTVDGRSGTVSLTDLYDAAGSADAAEADAIAAAAVDATTKADAAEAAANAYTDQEVADLQPTSEKGQPDGYVPLDEDALIPETYLRSEAATPEVVTATHVVDLSDPDASGYYPITLTDFTNCTISVTNVPTAPILTSVTWEVTGGVGTALIWPGSFTWLTGDGTGPQNDEVKVYAAITRDGGTSWFAWDGQAAFAALDAHTSEDHSTEEDPDQLIAMEYPLVGILTDLADVLDFHDPVRVREDRIGVGTQALRQWGAVKRLGVDDGVQIEVEWVRGAAGADPNTSDVGWQPGPAAFVDPAAADPLEVGLANFYDISVSSASWSFWGLWNVFDVDDYLQVANYVLYEANFGPAPLSGSDGLNEGSRLGTIIIRAFGGKVAGYFRPHDAETPYRLWGPVDVPAEFAGRDGWGFNNIMAQAGIADVGNIGRVRISTWTEDLGSYPAAPAVVESGSTAKASAAGSVDVPYPTTVTEGEKLVAFVCCNNGTIATPAGWTLVGQRALTLSFRLVVFEKTADGTEAGSETFSRDAGTSSMGGVIFSLDGCNPNTDGFLATQSNAASETIAAPEQTIQGQNRLVLWAGGRTANEDITVPAGFTEIAQLGTADAAINFAVAYKVFSESPQAATGSIVGSWTSEASLNSVGISMQWPPDPVE